jgi:LuxR family maltose regulon positive regulatory protein
MGRVLIVDDHAFLRRGLRGILSTHPDWECCGEADTGESAVHLAGELHPDIVIMDVSMPGMGGVKATEAIRHAFPNVKVVLLTLHKSVELLRAGLLAGASGYILKSDAEDQLIAALEAANQDKIYVTRAISPQAVTKVLEEIRQSTNGEPTHFQANG